MTPRQLSSSRRARHVLAVLAPVAASVFVAACGGTPAASPPGATPPAGASVAAAGLVRLQTQGAEAFSRSTQPLSLPHRDYRCPGSVRVVDLTDRMAALLENTPKHQRLSLIDLVRGQRRLVLPRATSGRRGWWIGTVRLSDSWLVWEEVGPGDDLREAVDWRLYAAPLRRSWLSIGAPALVAAATTAKAGRPLFDVADSRVAWVSTAWEKTTAAIRAELVVRDLGLREQRVLYTSPGVLDSVSFSGAHLVLGETLGRGERRERFVVLNAESGEAVARFDPGDNHGLSHWPAWRDGRLAWAPFPSHESAYPHLYVGDASERVGTDGGFAVDPCFVGGYLFYQAWRTNPALGESTAEVRALRLSDMTSHIVEAGRPDKNEWWHGVYAAPDVSRTYIAYLDRARRAENPRDEYTIVRVYDVK